MKNALLKFSIVISLGLFLFSSCQATPSNTDVETSSVALEETPMELIDNTPLSSFIKTQKFEVDCAEDYTTITEKGMIIEIPKGSLTDESGKTFKGMAHIEVQEYYSPGEIIASNLPMHYKKEGKLYHFQSDGMFTINAQSENGSLKIADNKRVKLTTQRAKAGEGFDFYCIDEEGNWEKDDNNSISTIENTKQLEVLLKPNPTNLFEPVKFDPNLYTIENDQRQYLPKENQTDLQGDYITQININVNDDPWILDRKAWKFGHTLHYSNLILKTIDEKEKKYDTVRYETVAAVRGNKKYERLKNEYETATAKYKMELTAYNENYTARKAVGQISAAELSQELLVDKFGTYNIDRFLDRPEKMLVEKKYQISSPTDVASNAKIYLIAKNSKGEIFPIDLSMYPNEIRFNKVEKNALLAITTQKIYGIKKNNFEATAKSQIKNETFDFKLETIECSDIKEFDETIESLF